MSCLHEKVLKFIELADGNKFDKNSSSLLLKLVDKMHQDNEQLQELITYTLNNPDILVMPIGVYLVYDFFYEKVVSQKHTSKMYDFWVDILITITILLKEIQGNEMIMMDKTYIYRLQSSALNHLDLFVVFLEKTTFELGDTKFLACSLASRGETAKLQVLADKIDISNFDLMLFSTALKFGRYQVLELLADLNMIPSDRCLNMAHYKHNHRYMYYTVGMNTVTTEAAVIGSKQNYPRSLRYILSATGATPTIKTLEIWADTYRLNKIYGWDTLNFAEIIAELRPYLKEPIPLTHDFGELNQMVHGTQWSNRSWLVAYCQQLELQLENLEQRYNVLENLYQQTQEEEMDNSPIVED